jgi:hypothetical protein
MRNSRQRRCGAVIVAEAPAINSESEFGGLRHARRHERHDVGDGTSLKQNLPDA